MKRLRSLLPIFCCLVFMHTPALATVVYDNTVHATGASVGPDTAVYELGDTITLAGTERVVTDFLFGYTYVWTDPGTAIVRFYGGGDGSAPLFTPFFTSDPFTITRQGDQAGLTGLSVTVPDTFTWTVEFSGPFPQVNGALRVANPPTIGSSDPNSAWQWSITGWMPITDSGPLNFLAQVSAEAAPVPEPTTLWVVGPWFAWMGARAWRRHRK